MRDPIALHQKFESIVVELFELMGMLPVEVEGDKGWDFTAARRYAVEIKYYRTARPQLGLIKRAAAAVTAIATSRDLHPILVVSCNLTGQQRLLIEQEFGLTVFDRIDLLISASRFEELAKKLAPLLEDESGEGLPADEGRDVGATLLQTSTRDGSTSPSRQAQPSIDNVRPPSTEGYDLCQELHALACGTKTWRKFEDLSERVVDYLFGEHFLEKSRQKITDDGLSRYDLIARATPQTDFWAFIINEVQSRYVVFEFKNYCYKIGQGQILTTEKYLLGHALRKCAFVFSRSGASPSADKMARGAVREHGKLIIVLNDDDLCSMLHMKDSGSDPTDYLFQCADKVFMTLSR
ncbi:hypothetical protein ACIGHF_00375 [Stenotrophomonas sp. NPDC077464]|uniref:hypothetical protein n=1 Tax=unclassified Stenotrophomonas TaxID=196198 RepID=UPI0037CE21DC